MRPNDSVAARPEPFRQARERGALHSRPSIRVDRPGTQPVGESGADPEKKGDPQNFSTQQSHRQSGGRASDPRREILLPEFERPTHSPEAPNTQNLSKLKTRVDRIKVTFCFL